MNQNPTPTPTQFPAILINPKVQGQGTVYRKDGTVSTPENSENMQQAKEQENGRNP